MRHRSASLKERLEATPSAFELDQAAWLAERLAPDAKLRLRGSFDRRFPSGTVSELRLDGERPVLTSPAFALGGPFGPLPTPASDDVVTAARAGRPAARDFLDHLNQRLIELLLAARRLRAPQHQTGAPFDSEAAVALFAVMGLATGGLRRTAAAPHRPRLDHLDRLLLRHAGPLGRRVRTLAGLERLLEAVLDVAVRAAPLAGGWVALPQSAAARLGHARLGGDATLGKRFWDQRRGIGLRLGPLGPDRLERFLPGGPDARLMGRLTAFHAGPRLRTTVELVPDRATTRGARLDRSARLGWTSWLHAAPGVDLAPVRLKLPVASMGEGDG